MFDDWMFLFDWVLCCYCLFDSSELILDTTFQSKFSPGILSGQTQHCKDTVIDACSRSSQWILALSLFSEITVSRRSLLSCTAALNACEKTDPGHSLLSISRELSDACQGFLQQIRPTPDK